MIRLIKAETTRLLSRRGIWIAAVVGIALMGAVLAILLFAITPPAVDDGQAERYYQEAHKYWEENHERERQACLESGTPPQSCEMPEPRREDFVPTAAPHSEALGIATVAASFIGFMAAAVAAGSLVGAEFKTGSLATQLTYSPRRTQVFLAKVLVPTLGMAVLGFVLVAVGVSGITALFAALQGADKLVGDWTLPLQAAGRAVSMAAMGGLLGAGLGFLYRNSIGPTATVLGYAFATMFLSLFSGVGWWGQYVTRWLPETNITAYLQDGTEWTIYTEKTGPAGTSVEEAVMRLSLGEGLAYWIGLLAVVTLVGWLLFRRRDVQ